MYKKNQKPTNEKTKSVAVFTHNWYASASNRPTSTCPRPSHRLRNRHHLSWMAALSVKRGNSPSPLKDKHSPQANWDNSRLLKKVGHTSWSPMRPARREQKNFVGLAKKKRYKSEIHKELGTSLTHLLKKGKDVKIHLQSAFSYSPTAVMIKAKYSPLWVPCAVKQIIILRKYFY